MPKRLRCSQPHRRERLPPVLGAAFCLFAFLGSALCLLAGCHREFRFDEPEAGVLADAGKNDGAVGDSSVDALDAPDDSSVDALDGSRDIAVDGSVDGVLDGAPAAPDEGATDHGGCSADDCPFQRNCAGSNCSLKCAFGKTCVGTCNDGCMISCEDLSSCTGSAGQGATAQCDDSSVCSFTMGGGATISCESGSTCHITCTQDCKVTCAGQCDLTCVGRSGPKSVPRTGASCS